MSERCWCCHNTPWVAETPAVPTSLSYLTLTAIADPTETKERIMGLELLDDGSSLRRNQSMAKRSYFFFYYTYVIGYENIAYKWAMFRYTLDNGLFKQLNRLTGTNA